MKKVLIYSIIIAVAATIIYFIVRKPTLWWIMKNHKLNDLTYDQLIAFANNTYGSKWVDNMYEDINGVAQPQNTKNWIL